jgi:two-component system alkaline phosphatase synthesis response regulator PhoP
MKTLSYPEAIMCVVLTVDDDPTLRALMIVMLKRLNCQPIAAESGIEAERMLASFHPKLVLLDIMMPMQDGYETCRHLRLRGYWGRVLFVSANPIEPEKVKACGADGFIQKPITLMTLAQQVNAVYAASA